jgi:hypothetical protein
MNKDFIPRNLGFYHPIEGNTSFYDALLSDVNFDAVKIHENIHQIIGETSSLTPFIQVLTAIKNLASNTELKDLIDFLIGMLHRYTIKPQESIATWLMAYYAKYRSFDKSLSTGEIEIPIEYLEHYDILDQASSFTPTPKNLESAINIGDGVVHIGIFSLCTTIAKGIASLNSIDRDAITQYFTIPKNNPEKRFELLLDYITTKKLSFSHFSIETNPNIIQEINKNLFEIPFKQDNRPLKNSYLVKQAGPEAKKFVDQFIYVNEESSAETADKEYKVYRQYPTFVLSRNYWKDHALSDTEFVEQVTLFMQTDREYFLEIRPTWEFITDDTAIPNIYEFDLTFYGAWMNESITTTINSSALNQIIKEFDGPLATIIFSSYMFRFDTQKIMGFEEKLDFAQKTTPPIVLVPATSEGIVKRLVSCLRKGNIPATLYRTAPESQEKVEFLVLTFPTPDIERMQNIVFLPSEPRLVDKYIELFKKNVKLYSLEEKFMESFSFYIDWVAACLTGWGWAKESSENDTLQKILPTEELNIPCH